MLTPTVHKIVLAAAAATLVPLTALTVASPASAAGPACDGYDTILNGQYTLIPLKNQAMLTEERCGYRFRAGQQNSRIEITERDGGLFFHDKGSASWKSVEAPCASDTWPAAFLACIGALKGELPRPKDDLVDRAKDPFT